MKKIDFLKKGDGIGITAPSDGLGKETDFVRLESAKKNLEARGYFVSETENVRTSIKGKSAEAKKRAEQFMRLTEDPEIRYIVSACGGDYLMELLPYLDFETIGKDPKWIQGYSDNTGLLFPITTICDMPTVYAGNIGDYGMKEWHPAVRENLSVLEGKLRRQKNFDLYENEFHEKITGVEGYHLTERVSYRLLAGDEASFTGRLIGGCLDVLIGLAGTRFDHTLKFLKKYEKDGFIWYLESFALSSARLEMALWQLKEAGWFSGVKGFLFGRPCFFQEEYEVGFEEATENVLAEFGVPIITGCDIGHRPPRLTVINGLMAEVRMEKGKFSLTYLEV